MPNLFDDKLVAPVHDMEAMAEGPGGVVDVSAAPGRRPTPDLRRGREPTRQVPRATLSGPALCESDEFHADQVGPDGPEVGQEVGRIGQKRPDLGCMDAADLGSAAGGLGGS